MKKREGTLINKWVKRTSSFCTNQSFFLGEELPKGDKVLWKQNILLQIHFLFGKNIRLKGDIFIFFEKGIGTFMPTGYSFKSSLK